MTVVIYDSSVALIVPHHHDHQAHHHQGSHHDSGSPHHGHRHEHHHRGLWHFIASLFGPHSHDASEHLDDALKASTEGIRTVKISLVALGITAVIQLAVVLASGSTALLADTVHNVADASTAIPLWLAFSLARRPPRSGTG